MERVPPVFKKPVIGIVGGVGAGKSTVATEFTALGCALIDGDAIGHELLGDAQVLRELRERWGDGVFAADGGVDRKALADIVFQSPSEMAALERILHPRIRRRMEERIAGAGSDVPAIVVDAAVLFEAGWDDLCTHKVFVDAPAERRAARAASGRAWNEAQWLAREKSQISLDTKRQRCDYIIDNGSRASRLRGQVRECFQKIVHSAEGSR